MFDLDAYVRDETCLIYRCTEIGATAEMMKRRLIRSGVWGDDKDGYLCLLINWT